jgi:type IV secretory pathway VirB10-like protein
MRHEAGAGVTPISPNPYAGGYGPSTAVAAPCVVDQRLDAYRAALAAPLVASGPGITTHVADDGYPEGGVRSTAYGELAQGSTFGTAAQVSSAGFSPSIGSVRQQGRDESRGAKSNVASTSFRTSVESAPGPLAIQAGTVIPAVLVTEINSDLPGQVLAQVARDMYDSRSLRTLLIPKGSKLLGKYADQIGVGQDRLLVAWSRVILPDGRSIALPGLETKDRTGAGGLHDQVDRHGGQVFGTAALLSLIGAGAQLSQPNAGYGALGSYPSPGQVVAGAVGQQLADVATQMLRRDLNVQPTIRIRQGMPFNVFLAMDLVFSEPYAPEP